MNGRLLDSVGVNVTALAGGVGGAKLLVGLDRALEPGRLTAIVNTGDDATIYGVHISPDVDIVTYWLGGVADTDRGWGIRNDTFEVVDALKARGVETWFRLGDRDFATCIYRTMRLRAGASLGAVTDELRKRFGVATRVVPATDDDFRTLVHTTDGRTLEFQEYFVRERQRPDVESVEYAGAAQARPAPGVIDAIETADRVILCPSNPVLSIGPILALPGVRDALRAHPNVLAVTPIIRGIALKGPADRILMSMGRGSSASSVARLYADFLDVFVVDATDIDEMTAVEAANIRAVALDTFMYDHDASLALAEKLLVA
jgi:LPPG:FO 2-phospho-L-lactate transferase